MSVILGWLQQHLIDDSTAGHFLLALLLGTVIGLERQWRQRTAGLRTNALVALGAASFVDIAENVAESSAGVTQVLAYVVSGVGFLGAGAIMKEGTNIRGLNTAATIWCSAAVGAGSAAGQYEAAIATTFGVVFLNVTIRWVVQAINAGRSGYETGAVPHVIRLSCPQPEASRTRSILMRHLEKAGLSPLALDSAEDAERPGMVELRAEVIGAMRRARPVFERITQDVGDEIPASEVRWRLASSVDHHT